MQWMIYGANGYTGELIAREAVRMGLQPILAGRTAPLIQALARELDLESRVFGLDDPQDLAVQLAGVHLVLNCAGPFSHTAEPMVEACIASRTHYLDITGEVDVFEMVHDAARSARAREQGVVLCSGVGFDVVPTDCVAMKLKEQLPDAQHLRLGFETRSGFSPGTLKTVIDGLSKGNLQRVDGVVVSRGAGMDVDTINFGQGERVAMSIPWGDVSTAYYSTGIPNISVWVPVPPPLVWGARLSNVLRPVIGLKVIQKFLQRLVAQLVYGPTEEERARHTMQVWGEATNSQGKKVAVRIKTANGYQLTIDSALLVAVWLLSNEHEGGSYTPGMLLGSDILEKLPGSGQFQIEAQAASA